MVTADELEVLARTTIQRLRRLSPLQRDVVVTRILKSDPELEPVLPALLATYESAKRVRRLGPLRRDGVS